MQTICKVYGLQEMPVLLSLLMLAYGLKYDCRHLSLLQTKIGNESFCEDSSTSIWQKMVQEHEIAKALLVFD